MDYKLNKDKYILKQLNRIRKIKEQKLKSINNTENFNNKEQNDKLKKEYHSFNELYFLNISSIFLFLLSIVFIIINFIVSNLHLNIIPLVICLIIKMCVLIRYCVLMKISKGKISLYSFLFILDMAPIIMSYTFFNIISIIIFVIFYIVFIIFASITYMNEINKIDFSIYEYNIYLSQHLLFLFFTSINFLIKDLSPVIVISTSIITFITILILELLVIIKKDTNSNFLKYKSIMTSLQTCIFIAVLIIYYKLNLNLVELIITISLSIIGLLFNFKPTKIAKLIEIVKPTSNSLKISYKEFKNIDVNNKEVIFLKNISNETLLFEAIEFEFIKVKAYENVIKPENVFSIELDKSLLKTKYGYKLFFKINSNSQNYVIDLTFNEKLNNYEVNSYPI